jgi:vitamin B12 transporter
MRKYYLSISLAIMGWTVKAQDTLKTVQLDDVVITGTKYEIPVEKSGKSIYKITKKDIDNDPVKSIANFLNEVPGIQMDGNFGPMGTNIGYFIRGASSKRTLVLVDGIPFNDPSGIDQTFDLRLLDISQVESMEILKGGLSTLYGTGAAAGVINIKLKQPEKETFEGSVKFGYGSFNSITSGLSLNGNSGKISYLFNAGHRKSDGFSSAADVGGSTFDDDGFKGFNFLGKVDLQVSKLFEVGFSASLDDFESEFDVGAFLDGDNTSDYQQLRIGVSPKLKVGTGNLSGDIFYSKLDRLFDSPDFFDPTQRFIDEYQSETIQADLILDQNLASNIKLIGGINFQNQSFSQPNVEETTFYWTDPYITFIYDQSNFNIQIGSRLNAHSEYGSKLVYNINPSYIIPFGDLDMKLMGSYSTSYITPSLYQIFGPFGNIGLEVEESKSFELGTSIYHSRVSANIVYFKRKDESLIDFRSLFDSNGSFIGGEYFNSDNEIETYGIEFDTKVQLSQGLALSTNYTFVKAADDFVLNRIPNHKYGISLSYQAFENINFGVRHLHSGERNQLVFNSNTFLNEEFITDPYDLFDLTANVAIKDFIFSGSVNNVLDEEYVAIVGFTSIGRNYSFGITYDF